MNFQHSLTRVVLVPRNGYINRLQAWASSAILAQKLNLTLEIAWEPEHIAAAEWFEIFAPQQISARFCDVSVVNEILGISHHEWPRYLTFSPDNATVVLAGHDRGEQAFIPDLLAQLALSKETRNLIIIAGGKFDLPSDDDFEHTRRIFYSTLNWVDEIKTPATSTLSQHRVPYIGLHVRGTDHSRSAPTSRSIKKALLKLSGEYGIKDLYIATDTAKSRALWNSIAIKLGLRPWSYDTGSYERTSASAGIDAMVEWNLLSKSHGMVYSKISSFAEEASVASGYHDRSIGLSASAILQKMRAISSFMRSAISRINKRANNA